MSTTICNPEDAPVAAAERFAAAELRLRRHAEFQRVYNATKKQHGKQMSFFAARREVPSGEYAGPRIGLTVGRLMGKAHERNRIKRRLREAVRAEQAALKGLSLDVVLHPRRSVETLPFEQLRAEVAEVFRRAASPRVGGSGSPRVGESASQRVIGSDQRVGGVGQQVSGAAQRASGSGSPRPGKPGSQAAEG